MHRPPADRPSEVLLGFFIVGLAILALVVLMELGTWSLYAQIAAAFAKLG